MLIANALLQTELEIPSHIINYRSVDLRHKKVLDILNLFNNDKRGVVAPFSI